VNLAIEGGNKKQRSRQTPWMGDDEDGGPGPFKPFPVEQPKPGGKKPQSKPDDRPHQTVRGWNVMRSNVDWKW
jgi:hypothetical protein